MRKIPRSVGSWVSGDRFYNRDFETQALIERLDEGAHLLLIAPRRVGKTSLMREVGRRIDGRYCCLHVDLQDCRSAADAVVELSLASRTHSGLWERVREVFGGALRRVEEVGNEALKVKLRDGVGSEWRSKGRRLFEVLAQSEPPVVLFFDEVPILVNRLLKGEDRTITPERVREVDLFVSWLRAMSQRHQDRIRLVVTGSIGFGPVLRQAGLSAAINHLAPFRLEPWSHETAKGCLAALAENYGLDFGADARQAVVDRLGCCVPHHVQVFFGFLHDDARRRRERRCTPEDVERIYRERMLSSDGHAELVHLEDRLRLVLQPRHFLFAMDLLSEAATGSLTGDAAVALTEARFPEDERGRLHLREVLGVLEHDGYLQRDADTWVFVSLLVRDWWRARFGVGYRSILEPRSPP